MYIGFNSWIELNIEKCTHWNLPGMLCPVHTILRMRMNVDVTWLFSQRMFRLLQIISFWFCVPKFTSHSHRRKCEPGRAFPIPKTFYKKSVNLSFCQICKRTRNHGCAADTLMSQTSTWQLFFTVCPSLATPISGATETVLKLNSIIIGCCRGTASVEAACSPMTHSGQ